METENIGHLVNSNSERVTVRIGLKDNLSMGGKKKLQLYLGNDGSIAKEEGFGMYIVSVTPQCLSDIIHVEPIWIDFIEKHER